MFKWVTQIHSDDQQKDAWCESDFFMSGVLYSAKL